MAIDVDQTVLGLIADIIEDMAETDSEERSYRLTTAPTEEGDFLEITLNARFAHEDEAFILDAPEGVH